jgi:hypothetical protein
MSVSLLSLHRFSFLFSVCVGFSVSSVSSSSSLHHHLLHTHTCTYIRAHHFLLWFAPLSSFLYYSCYYLCEDEANINNNSATHHHQMMVEIPNTHIHVNLVVVSESLVRHINAYMCAGSAQCHLNYLAQCLSLLRALVLVSVSSVSSVSSRVIKNALFSTAKKVWCYFSSGVLLSFSVVTFSLVCDCVVVCVCVCVFARVVCFLYIQGIYVHDFCVPSISFSPIPSSSVSVSASRWECRRMSSWILCCWHVRRA